MAGGGGKPFGDNVFAGHAAAGAAAISASAVAVHPLDTVKSLLQASARPASPLSDSPSCCAALLSSGSDLFPRVQLSAAGQKQKMGLRQAVDRLMHVSGPAGVWLLACLLLDE